MKAKNETITERKHALFKTQNSKGLFLFFEQSNSGVDELDENLVAKVLMRTQGVHLEMLDRQSYCLCCGGTLPSGGVSYRQIPSLGLKLPHIL